MRFYTSDTFWQLWIPIGSLYIWLWCIATWIGWFSNGNWMFFVFATGFAFLTIGLSSIAERYDNIHKMWNEWHDKCLEEFLKKSDYASSLQRYIEIFERKKNECLHDFLYKQGNESSRAFEAYHKWKDLKMTCSYNLTACSRDLEHYLREYYYAAFHTRTRTFKYMLGY